MRGIRSGLAVLLTLILAPRLSHAVAHPIANATNYLPISSYDGSGELVEPDVVYTPNGWHGFEYWMVVTPAPCGHEELENPSIYGSHDGQTWSVPSGVTNPISPLPPPGNAYYNNDPTLTFSPDSQLVIYYNYTTRGGPPADSTDVERLVSSDGVHWSAATKVFTRVNYPLSPTVIYDQGQYLMWYIVLNACGDASSTVYRRTSTNGLSWSAETACTIWSGSPIPWHFNIRRDGAKYVMVFTGYNSASGCGDSKRLYYAESSNGGLTWSMPQTGPILTPHTPGPHWDDQTIYRAGFMSSGGYLRLWYTGNTTAVCSPDNDSWHVGYTEGCWNGGDCIPPAAVTNLGAGSGRSTAAVSWTAPGEDGSVGQATAYDLRWSHSTITELNFGSAASVGTPTPGVPGTTECVELSGLSSCAWYYYALKTQDAAGNWSPLSNVAATRTKCSGSMGVLCAFDLRMHEVDDEGQPTSLEFPSPAPNPARNAVALRFSVPTRLAGSQFDLSVFDLSGRRLRTVLSGMASRGESSGRWDLRGASGERVRPGLYFLRLSLGREQIRHQVMVLD